MKNAAQSRLDQVKGNPASSQADINAAQTDLDAATLKADALEDTFRGVYNPTAINTQILQSVGPPEATGNNRKSTLEASLLVGLVVGLLIGLGLASLIDLRARSQA